MKLKILRVNAKPFSGQGGEEVAYYWTKAEMEDGTKIEFGTKNDYTDIIGETEEIEVEKQVFSNGKKGFKEVYN